MMGFGAGFGWLGLLVMLGLVIGVIFVVVWAAQASTQRSEDVPLNELRASFARGEIDAAQFDERRRVLGETAGAAGRNLIGLIGLVLIVTAVVLALILGSSLPDGGGMMGGS